ncbi:hypothetical protein [Streptomyces sp. NPDC026673]|uniref:hypothetical protein n=1 Tax=Streptomyces sp. NPDC026673 TaxID=3155724 RepID=UPI0033E3E58F
MAALLLSLFAAIGCVAAEPVPASGRGAGGTAARAESGQPDCLARQRGSNGIRLVLPGTVSVPAPAPAPRGGTGSDETAPVDGPRVSAAVTAPRTARQAIPLARSGELPVTLRVFRC